MFAKKILIAEPSPSSTLSCLITLNSGAVSRFLILCNKLYPSSMLFAGFVRPSYSRVRWCDNIGLSMSHERSNRDSPHCETLVLYYSIVRIILESSRRDSVNHRSPLAFSILPYFFFFLVNTIYTLCMYRNNRYLFPVSTHTLAFISRSHTHTLTPLVRSLHTRAFAIFFSRSI